MGKSISTEGVTFQYDEAVVINSLSLSIERGSFISIIGPNGSGKSTLLKLLAANIIPQGGAIFIEGQNVKDYGKRALSREMAVVPQETNVNYAFQVYDIVLMGRYPHRGRFQRETKEDRKIVKEAMERTNTWQLRNRKINELSGGEGQRVILARALAQEPQLILLDEPTASLDIHHQLEVLELLKSLNEERNVTIIAVLHDLNLAARYSQEILLLHSGKKITMGKTEEVLTVENLKQAYDMEMMIERNLYTNRLMIHPLGVKAKTMMEKGPRVHLVCGGGTARELIPWLLELGAQITLGVVNQRDSDWDLGKQLRLEMAEEVPFSEISDEALLRAEALAQDADFIIMTSIPLGWGNLKNLNLLKHQLDLGKRVYLFNRYPREKQFDYTEGQGTEKLRLLKEKGLRECSTKEELLKELMINGN